MDTRERKCRAPRPQLLLLHVDQDVGAVGARQVNCAGVDEEAGRPFLRPNDNLRPLTETVASAQQQGPR